MRNCDTRHYLGNVGFCGDWDIRHDWTDSSRRWFANPCHPYLGLLNRTYNGSCQASCPLRHWFINFISKSNAVLWLQIQIIHKNETAFLSKAIWVCVSSSKCLFKILILFSYWLLSLTGYLGHLSSRIYGFTLFFLIAFFFFWPCHAAFNGLYLTISLLMGHLEYI